MIFVPSSINHFLIQFKTDILAIFFVIFDTIGNGFNIRIAVYWYKFNY